MTDGRGNRLRQIQGQETPHVDAGGREKEARPPGYLDEAGAPWYTLAT
jgi:hypothetical protein